MAQIDGSFTLDGSKVVMGGTLAQIFFKPEKNLEFFRLKICARDAYPGKLEWLAVNNLVYFLGLFCLGLWLW